MTKRVRPEVKHPNIVNRTITSLEKNIDVILSSLSERPDNLQSFNEAIEAAIVADALGEPDELTVQYLQLALQLGVAHFISALELPEDFGVYYLGKTYPYKIERSKAYTDPGSWGKVVNLAIILRHQEALQIMCRIPTDALKEANIEADKADLTFVEFIKGLFDPNADIGDRLIVAMEATEPDDYSKERAHYLLDIRAPLLSLYRCFLSDDQEEFNEKLKGALTLHQEFWVDAPHNEYGWISLDLVAMLSLAHDNKQWSVSVETDYIPSWLATGELV